MQDFENISLLTVIEDNVTNQFEITKSKTGILIDGDAYDATKLIQTIIDSDNQKFFYFDTKLEIRLKNLIKSNNNLRDFIMIGQLKSGNLVNLSSKVEDDIGSFLDINYNNKDNKSTLKIFSTNPLLLLEEFPFFEGIRNGELEFEYLTSETSKTGSLKIKSFNLKEKPYSIDIQEVVDRTAEAFEMGASEVCLQGGIHPDYTGEFYLNMVKEIKQTVPEMHIHGFTPLEIWQGAETINLSIEDYLKLLLDAGLNTLPGTAAEILDDRVRKYLCPDKITSSQWAYVMEVAHSLGMKSTATIMFGHIDDIDSWVNHFSLIKNIQLKTGGFTEVVPLPFVHMGSPIYLQGKSMPGPTWDEVVLIHSLARIYFSNVINNIQASWVKLGHDGAGKLLDAGVNDLGGTLINENISRASGADHGQETTDQQFIDIIENCNKTPILRNTLYTEFKNPKTLIPYS